MENSEEFLCDFTQACPHHRCLKSIQLVPFMSPQQMSEPGVYAKEKTCLLYPHISEICIMLHIILMISYSPSRAAIQAFCVAQHCSSGRRKETWARLLQARTEWWKTVMWQCCISSVWNDSEFLLSLGAHRGLGQTTTPNGSSWISAGCCQPNLWACTWIPKWWPVHSKWQEQRALPFVLCVEFV